MAQWNVTDAVWLQEFNILPKQNEPSGIWFKPDGTKMYIVGYQDQSVDEYDLGTQWDVSTAVYLHEFSVGAKETSPQDVYFKPDGTKMYVIGSDGDTVDEYDLGVQWDVTTAVYLQEFSVAVKEGAPRGMYIKPDGTKMYTAGSVGNSVDEYDLGVQWDVSSAVYLQEFSVAAKEAEIRGVYFKPDGTKMYTVGSDGDTVDEYDLGTQWDVSTAVYLHEISVAAKDTDPTGFTFKPDGTKMYIVGYDDRMIDEYDL